MSSFLVHVLASGSKGNSTLVQIDTECFLIDLGISCRELTKKLKECGLEPSQLKGVFITHEHSDHIKGMTTFMKKHSVPIYTSRETWRSIGLKLGKLNPSQCFSMEQALSFEKVIVSSFPIPHDARDPHGYSFFRKDNHSKFTYLTDTGFVTDTVLQAAEGCEALVLETNHDIEMLKNGPYPYNLKQRILSTQGHLSNKAAGWLLTQLKQLPKDVFLAHLSQENNRPSLALQTVSQHLEEVGKLSLTNLHVTSQNNIVSNKPQIIEKTLF